MKTNRTVPLIVSSILAGALLGCAENATAPETLVASRMEPASSTDLLGTVGKAVSERPTVIVRDQHGMPMAGVRVVFSTVFTNGTLYGVDVLTDASGHASVGEWILSTTAGTNVIRAARGPLQVEFSALGVADAPAELRKVSGDNQVALSGSTLVVAQTVRVLDAYENPVAGVKVSFAVTAGGGSLAGGSAISNTAGIASIAGWTLGSGEVQSLSASVDGVAAVSFNATTATDLCTTFPITSGELPPGDLGALGCTLDDGRPANLYALTTTERKAYEFELTSETFTAVLTMTKNGIPVSETFTRGIPPGKTRVILTPGDYLLRVSPKFLGEGGRYQLSSHVANEAVSDCTELFLTLGIKTSQALEKGDCEPLRGYYADNYFIYLEAGKKVTVTMGSVEVDNVIEVTDDAGNYVTGTHATGMYDGIYGARVEFTPKKSAYYHIVATTDYFNGRYTLTVE